MTGNYPAMNARMRIHQMPIVAKDIFEKYRSQLSEHGSFDLDQFIAELNAACQCKNDRSTMEMMSVLWHATKDPALVYYLDNLESKPIEFEFYVARAYGLKDYRHPSINEHREKYWEKFKEDATQETDSLATV